MRRLAMNGTAWDSVFLAFVKILTMLFGIVFAKILSVGLSLEDYGTYSQAMLVNSVGASMIALGLSDAVNYYYNRRQSGVDDAQRMRIVNTVYFIEIALGLFLAAAIILAQMPIVRYFTNESLGRLLPVVAFMPVLSNLLYSYQVVFVSIGKAKLMSVFNVGITLLRILLVFLAVYVLENLYWIFMLLVLLELGQIMGFHLLLNKQGVRICPLKISRKHIREIISYGLPIGVYTLTSSLSRELDKMVIGRFETTETMAIYANCSKLLPFDVLVVSFATILMPFIVRYVTEGDGKKLAKLISSYLKVGYYSVWILATAVLIVPEAVISVLYAEAYVSGKYIFIAYIFDSMLRFASIHMVLTAANRSKTLLGYSLLSLGLNLVLNIVFYNLMGVIGPAVATLVTALIYTWLILRKTFMISGISWRDVFDIREMALFAASLALGWAVSVMLNKTMLQCGWNFYLAAVLTAGIFVCVMLAVHFRKITGAIKEINTFRI